MNQLEDALEKAQATRVSSYLLSADEATDLRQPMEPWLSIAFGSEHLSLLVGSGFARGGVGA
jgi:hypothetical protein